MHQQSRSFRGKGVREGGSSQAKSGQKDCREGRQARGARTREEEGAGACQDPGAPRPGGNNSDKKLGNFVTCLLNCTATGIPEQPLTYRSPCSSIDSPASQKSQQQASASLSSSARGVPGAHPAAGPSSPSWHLAVLPVDESSLPEAAVLPPAPAPLDCCLVQGQLSAKDVDRLMQVSDAGGSRCEGTNRSRTDHRQMGTGGDEIYK